MALLIGSFGPSSSRLHERSKIVFAQRATPAHLFIDPQGAFFFQGFVDQANDQIIPLGQRGMIAGRLFNKTTYTSMHRSPEALVDITPEQLMNHYWGRYGMVLWDEASNSMLLMRDPIGLSTMLYYQLADGTTVFSTQMDALYDLLEEKPEINWDHFTEFLADVNHALTTTPFIGVHELLPGVLYTIKDAQISQRLVWQPPTQSEQFVHQSDEEIIQGLQKELINCTRAWLDGVTGVTVQLSGGLDSSGLLALYKKVSNGAIPIIAVHYTDSKNPSTQEEQYAQQIANECDVPIISYDYQNTTVIGQLPQDWLPLRPSMFFVFNQASQFLFKQAEQNQCKEIISGQGGDHIFLAPPPLNSIADYWLDCGFSNIQKPLHELSGLHRMPLWELAKTNISALWRYYLGKKADDDIFNFKRSSTLLAQKDNSSFYLDQVLQDYYPAKSIHVRLISNANAYAERDQRFSHEIVTHPLLSQPLVEYALKIPTYRTIHNGYSRYYFRSALNKLQPSNIWWRRSKGEFSATFQDIIKKDLGNVSELLKNGELARRGIINREWIEEEIAKIQHNVGSAFITFLRVIACEMWLKQWKGRSF